MEEGDSFMIINDMRNLDTVRANLFEPIIIAEDDESSHVLTAQLLVNGELLKIMPDTGYTVKLFYRMANDQTGEMIGVCTDEGKIRVEIPNEALTLDDIVECDLCVNYRRPLTTHTLEVVNNELVATPHTSEVDTPLRTGLFKIDARYRVIV